MIRITTLLTFSFIFLFGCEYANAQFAAPGTRPHSGVSVASLPGTIPSGSAQRTTAPTIPAYVPGTQATIPTYQGSAPGYRPGYRQTYQAPGSTPAPQRSYAPAPAYTPAQRYTPAPQYIPAPRYRQAPVYVPSAPVYTQAPTYIPTPVYVPSAPVYTQAPTYVPAPEPVYVPGTDRDAYMREHRRWEEEHARWEAERARHGERDHNGEAYRGGDRAAAAQGRAQAEDARMGHDNGRHLGWDKNGRGGDQR